MFHFYRAFKAYRKSKKQQAYMRLEKKNSIAVPFNYPIEPWVNAPTIAVMCHMYYVDLIDEISSYLNNIGFPFDLFITTNTLEKKQTIEAYYTTWKKGRVTVVLCENRGRDIAPKLIALADVYSQYEFFLHIHTKNSPHYAISTEWRRHLFNTLIGSKEIVESIFDAFRNDAKLGMIAPINFSRCNSWYNNFELAKPLLAKLNLKMERKNKLHFPAGSMLWGRSAALVPLLNCKLSMEDFPEENDQKDGTLAHAIERLYFYVGEIAGYNWIRIITSCKPLLHKK